MPVELGTFVPPKLSGAPSSPVSGQLYYDTGTNTLYWYNGTTWVSAAGGAGSDTIRYDGAWAAGTYTDGDIVVDGGIAYICQRTTTNRPTAWSGIGQAYVPPALVTSLPGSPTDGQQVIFTNSTSAPAYQWLMQYVAAITTWICIGAGGWLEGTTTVTVPRAGDYYCQIGGIGLGVGAATADDRYLTLAAGGITLQPQQGQGGGQNNLDRSSMFDEGKMTGLTTSQVLTPTVSGSAPGRQYIRIQAVKMT